MKKKIVIIEDNPDIRENIKEILELDNYEVFDADNGKEGVKLVIDKLPDLILCDIMMPVMDGYSVLHILNKKPETSNIPFVFLTAKAEKADFRKGMNMGATDYLSKPFEIDDLLQVVEQRIEKNKIYKNDYDQNLNGVNDFFSDAKAQLTITDFLEKRETRTYEKKEFLFREGKEPFYLFYIINGNVKIFEKNEVGKELITNIVSEGDFLGYQNLIEESSYNLNAVALDTCQVSLIPKEDFLKLIYLDANIAQKFLKLLSKNLTEKHNQLLDLAYSSVRKRVANSLVLLAEKTNSNKNNDIIIKVLREDLAALAGTAKETAIRVLSDLKESELILIENDGITIKDLSELKKVNW